MKTRTQTIPSFAWTGSDYKLLEQRKNRARFLYNRLVQQRVEKWLEESSVFAQDNTLFDI